MLIRVVDFSSKKLKRLLLGANLRFLSKISHTFQQKIVILHIEILKIVHLMQVNIINKSRHALPSYATALSAGMDLRANIDEPITLQPLERRLVPTGIFIALPAGYEAQVRPRSGMATKHGITVINSPGTVDADYRGEIRVSLVNLSNEPFTIEDGERIAQMVVARHETVTWNQVESLDETERGAGGWGSTGTK